MDVQLRVDRQLVDSFRATSPGCATVAAMTSDVEHPTESRAARSRRLNPATVVLWREPDVVQLELSHKRIVIRNVLPEHLLALLPVRSRAGSLGSARVPAGYAELTDRLSKAGFLARRPAPGQFPAYLFPEFGCLLDRHGDRATDVLRRRRQAAVAVHGTSRVAVAVAGALASAGIGHIQLVGEGDVAAADCMPGGLLPTDEGSRFAVAATAAVQRNSPGVAVGPLGNRKADLVLLTDPVPIEPTLRDALHLDRVAHLAASVHGSRAVVGPLVLPGRTSCLRCADLHRTERDQRWPVLAMQLSARVRRRPPADTALGVAAVGLAAGQALQFLDGHQPETVEGTMEWHLPDWRLRRRTWRPHADCDCGAAAEPGRDGRMGL